MMFTTRDSFVEDCGRIWSGTPVDQPGSSPSTTGVGDIAYSDTTTAPVHRAMRQFVSSRAQHRAAESRRVRCTASLLRSASSSKAGV